MPKEEPEKEASSVVGIMLAQIQGGETPDIMSALHVLGQEESLPAEAYEQLAELLNHREEKVRHATLFLLLLAPEVSEEIKLEICKFIGDKDRDIQSVVATFIGGKMPTAPTAIQQRVYKAIVRSSNENFRVSALNALLQWIPPLPETLTLLADLIDHGTDDEKRMALLGFNDFPELASQEVTAAMFQLLKTSENAAVRMMAANTLSSIKGVTKEIEAYVVAFLADEKNMELYIEAAGL